MFRVLYVYGPFYFLTVLFFEFVKTTYELSLLKTLEVQYIYSLYALVLCLANS